MESNLRAWFQSSSDVEFKTMRLGSVLRQQSLLLVYCNGLVDERQINQALLPNLLAAFRDTPPQTPEELEVGKPLLMTKVPDPSAKDEVVRAVFEGNLLLVFQDLNALYTVNIAKLPSRKPDEPSTEISIRGARDGFVEEINVNVGLIRKRLPTNTMFCESFTIGTRSKTKVALLFLEDVANPTVVEQIREKLKNLQIDAIQTSQQLEEYLAEGKRALFPLFTYTGRPDFASMSIENGRVALLVDGSPTAIIAPVSLFFLLQGSSDSTTMFQFVGFQRFMRVVGLCISLLLPAFWVSLNGYHQDQLPYTLLATIVVSRQGVPMPAPIEALLVILLFELFREAGLRLPATVGQTLSVVGGLIIGQAAISAGLTSPSLLVIVATSSVASFILGNQDLSGTIRLLNMAFVMMSSVFGMFGFFVSWFALLLYLVNLRSFGVPYLAPVSPVAFPDLRRMFWPAPFGTSKKRPQVLHTQNEKRLEEEPE
ncbi:spore germination protein [Tumebacillus sp. ITR2]|uniref:Spore germination protein n=1 Tax=Tumebacillus amylolyticus TaxID=2801339 RepID=A0ABS1J627_9BACL|nr:spore germination protein [Tumebacillus amylolyticus]MBL0385687.1 spore germination protein [Tumebacillus amylolyticus]